VVRFAFTDTMEALPTQSGFLLCSQGSGGAHGFWLPGSLRHPGAFRVTGAKYLPLD
jgi:hypothetical protein